MRFQRLIKSLVIVAAIPVFASFAFGQQVPYETNVSFSETVAADLVKLLPRAMGKFLFENRVGFARGQTFINRSVRVYPLKMRDLQEIRKRAFANLMRDIPYCVEALKGGDIKLDSSSSNVAARLGMISYWIFLQKMPAFPDPEYLEKFNLQFERLIAYNYVDIWLFYDGYGDFNSLGALMERFKEQGMPTFHHVVNQEYTVRMRGDTYSMYRAPSKFKRNMLLTNVDIGKLYNEAMNCVLDAYLYIWKASGMDLAHPSYPIPPGTHISRPSMRRTIHGGTLAKITTQKFRQEETEEDDDEEGDESGDGDEDSGDDGDGDSERGGGEEDSERKPSRPESSEGR